MLEAAKISIPTTNPTKIKRQYWCYDTTVRQYRWALNRANKTLRKMTKLQHPNLQAYKATVQEATTMIRVKKHGTLAGTHGLPRTILS